MLILFIDGAKDAPKEDVENIEDNHADEVAEITQLRMRKILKVSFIKSLNFILDKFSNFISILCYNENT